jgi:hypothetical protein
MKMNLANVPQSHDSGQQQLCLDQQIIGIQSHLLENEEKLGME